MLTRRLFINGAGAAILAPALVACSTTRFSGSVGSKVVTQEALAYVNTLRANAGLTPFDPDSASSAAAREQAEIMARNGRMAHGNFGGRMRRNGVSLPAAENIAYGQPDTPTVIEIWANSSGHRRNMLGDYARVGVAYASRKDGRLYWAMVLSG
jgi:uncharacterized protein YkwD